MPSLTYTWLLCTVLPSYVSKLDCGRARNSAPDRVDAAVARLRFHRLSTKLSPIVQNAPPYVPDGCVARDGRSLLGARRPQRRAGLTLDTGVIARVLTGYFCHGCPGSPQPVRGAIISPSR